jgi:hypothetical protein
MLILMALPATLLQAGGIKNDPNRIKKIPVLFYGSSEIQRLKTNAQSSYEPFASAWNKVKENANQGFDDVINVYQGPDTVELRFTGLKQAGYVRDLMMVYLVEDDEKYARRAKEIFIAWAQCTPMPGKSCISEPWKEQKLPGSGLEGLGLNLGLFAVDWANAYCLVYEQLNAQQRRSARDWMLFIADEILRGHLAWTEKDYLGDQKFNNHITGHILGLASVGFAFNEQKWIDYAIKSDDNPRDFYEMHNGSILMPTKPNSRQLWHGDPTLTKGAPSPQAGEIYDRYRIVTIRDGKGCGLPYAMFNQKMLTQIAEMAFHNGMDLYSYCGPAGENLKTTYEFYADFMITGNPSVNGGYYQNNKLHLSSVHMYELANLRYPGTPKIMDVLEKQNRVQFDHEVFGYTACLIYGQ